MTVSKWIVRVGVVVFLISCVLMVVAKAIAPFIPYGEQIVYMSNQDLQYDLFLYDFNRRQTYQLTHTTTVNERYPAWSPDGRYLAYHASYLSDYDLYVMDVLNGNIQRMAFYGTHGEIQFNDEAMANWSPDGESIVFHAGRREENYRLYITNPEGTLLEQLTQDDGDYVHAYWSPDGSQLAYVQYEVNPNVTDGVLSIMDVEAMRSGDDSARDTALTSLVRGVFPAWSPDGSALAYVSNESGTDEIYLLDIVSGEITQLTFDSPFFMSTTPDWTPDGRIVFSSNRRGTYNIYIMERDGSNVRQITFSDYDAQAPAWRPPSR
jgi:TolB protein